MNELFIALICGIAGLIVAAFFAIYVLKQPEGQAKIREISVSIRLGALAFLRREYRMLSLFVVIIGVILGIIPALGWAVAATFIFGAITSALAGYIGMIVATRANSRTATAAEKSLNQGFKVSFRAGSVMGLSVVSISVVGLCLVFFIFQNNPDFLKIIPAFGFGVSVVAVFARVGGGIYTKAADVGADLVGKVEKGIPEDDPRNAAVIADFVGDNVGDVAGMGADLYESYVDAIIATVTLGAIAVFSPALGRLLVPDMHTAWLIPMLIAASGIVASIIGIFLVRISKKQEMHDLLNALRLGTWVASVLAAGAAFLIVKLTHADLGIFWAILAGLVAGVLIGETTNFFTSYTYKPVRGIAKASETGAGTNIISGFASGLMSTLPSAIIVAIAIILAYKFADVYGVAVAGIGMLATLGIQNATDAYGPIADNAGGLVEMAGLPRDIRHRTDTLDALGNTTAAAGKGFSVGSAALTALALLLAYTNAVGLRADDLSILNAHVIAGFVLGAALPAVFSSLALNAVGKTAHGIVNEVRRQFKEIAGIMEGTSLPDYAHCVDICARDAISKMIAPGLITIISPIVVGWLIGPAGLGGFLAGATVTGLILAVTFSNAGGAWDNAKKLIETGVRGGKGSDAHRAAIIGDTVGDPMKDTAGPSLNIMIKLASIIALVLAPVIANFTGII